MQFSLLVMNFVTDTATNTSNHQRTTSDSYYELILPEDSVTIPTRSSRKVIPQQQTTSSMESQLHEQAQQQQQPEHTSSTFDTTNSTTTTTMNSTISSFVTNLATPNASSAPRGRISRLKPKEDAYAMEELQNGCSSMTDSSLTISNFNAIESNALTASNATADLTLVTQTVAPVSEQKNEVHYPVIDDSKPFVCQQCGLAFAREKAMLSHAKVSKKQTCQLIY